MAGEWTVETLRIYLESLIASNDRRYEAALSAAKEAVVKAEVAAEKRFEGVNEFRAALDDRQRTFMPRAEAEQSVEYLKDRLTALEKVNIERSGVRQGGTDMRIWIFGAIAAIAGLLAIMGWLTRPGG